MLSAILAIGGIGCLAGLGLAIASKVFYVYVDPKIIEVEEALPGANCGGCGYPGCSGAAEAIATGKEPPNICVGGGPDIQYKIASIMGVEIKETEPEIAAPGCYYGLEDADLKYRYDGFNDCRAAVLLDGGPKVCPIGCIGLGTCVRACPFGALSMGPEGLPVVHEDLCTGCGTCERVCPKNIITLSSNSQRVQQEYTTDECTAPCQRECPAGIDIPAYIYNVAKGDYLEAVRVIKEKNPFPAVCGRICVHPCEYVCRRGLTDAPVAINYIKRYASDYEMKSGQHVEVAKAPSTDRKVAVVGGGAEGLTAAYFLARIGHSPTVFEGRPKLGGLLRTVIPENRLPREVLDWEIEGILETGVEAATGKKLGQDFTIDSLLKEGYEAVFVALGGWDTQLSEGPVEPRDVLPGVQLLAQFAINWRHNQKPAVGKNVMILGGGSASIDAARICRQSGAETVHILMRSPREEASFSEEQLRAAEEEGIQFHFNSALVKMMGEDSRLTHVQIAELEAAQEEGKTVVKEGSVVTVPVDNLLIGAGRFPELIYVPRKAEQEEEAEETPAVSTGPVEWETVVPYASPFAEEDIGIFRPGEAMADYKAVIEAIGSGRRAAASVNQALMGEAVEPPAHMIRKNTYVLGVEELEPISEAPRHPMPELPKEEQLADPSAEIEIGYGEKDAVEEAKRCLRCGLICYRRPQQSKPQQVKAA